MTKQKEVGDKGEDIARQYLQKLGYTILATNWHFHHYEIDIIAKDGDELVIVEVKSRSSRNWEHPSEAVGKRKIRFLIEAAEAYIFKSDSHCDTRFDVIAIIFQGDTYELEHYKDAFYPTA
ncbi:YraN family protein [Mangrovibacterium sp.]|uniref:YraN family protein n=1 Tax=Mangrovibacterium sp. TaxID=1961364 RepID=UPI00356516DD